MRIILALALLVTLTFTLTKVQARADATEAWVQLADGGLTYFVRAADYGCQWGAFSRPTINLPGMCGRSPTTRNVFMMYAHNLMCDQVWCPATIHTGEMSDWLSLRPGDRVLVHYAGRDYHGTVIANHPRADQEGIDGNTEFVCKFPACGTLTTSHETPHVGYGVIQLGFKEFYRE